MKVLLADIKDVDPALVGEAVATFPARRRAEIGALAQFACRARSAVGEAMVRRELMSALGLPASALPLGREAGGKPVLTTGALCFNVSHSGDCVACVFDVQPVGIDAEKIVPRKFLPIVKKYFSPEEKEEVQNAENPLSAFYRVWTKKESYLKFCGKGLRGLKETDGAGEARVFSFEWERGEDRILPDGLGRQEDRYAIAVCGKTSFEGAATVLSASDALEGYLREYRTRES